MAKKPQKPKKTTKAKKETLSLVPAVRRFIAQTSRPFQAKAVADYVKPLLNTKIPDLENEIFNILQVLRLTFYDKTNQVFISRQEYFTGAKFRTVVMANEIKDKILIVGHRFMPFCNPELPLSAFQLQLPDGNLVARRKIKKPAAEILPFYLRLGVSNIFQYLAEDNKNCTKVIHDKNSKASLTIPVFDMAQTYPVWKVQPEATLILTLLDWNEGRYGVEYVGKTVPAQEQLMALEHALGKVYAELGPFTDLSEQLAYTFFLAGKELLQSPGFAIRDFLVHCEPRFALVNMGSYLALAPKDQQRLTERFSHELEQPVAKDSLTEIFSKLGLPFTTEDIEACLRNELFHGRHDLQAAMSKIMVEPFQFSNAKQERRVADLVDHLWKKIEKEYNPQNDQLAGPLRSQLVDLFIEYFQWALSFSLIAGLVAEQMPFQELQAVTIAIAPLKTMLWSLNLGDQAVTGIEHHLVNKIAEMRCGFRIWRGEALRIADLPEEFLQLPILEMLANLEDSPAAPPKKKGKKALAQEALWGAGADDDEDSDADEETFGAFSMDEPPAKKSKRKGKGKSKAATKNAATTHLYQFRISLLGIKPEIWRRLQVPGDISLAELHDIVQDTMGWENCHLHSFHANGTEYGPSDNDPMFGGGDEMGEDENDCTVEELGLQEGEELLYVYDFGDSWEHALVVEKILPDNTFQHYPICLAGQRACPPEDCGGLPGFQHMLKVMKSPKHREYREMLEWLGGEPFDPNAFDIEEVNEILEECR